MQILPAGIDHREFTDWRGGRRGGLPALCDGSAFERGGQGVLITQGFLMTFSPGQRVYVTFKDGSVQKGKILALPPAKIFQPWANVAFSRHGILQPYLTVMFPTRAAACRAGARKG